MKGTKCIFQIIILTFMIPMNNFQLESESESPWHLPIEIIFTEEYRGLTESFITWSIT